LKSNGAGRAKARPGFGSGIPETCVKAEFGTSTSGGFEVSVRRFGARESVERNDFRVVRLEFEVHNEQVTSPPWRNDILDHRIQETGDA